jgi:type VI secretion system protein ImpH
MPLKRFRAFVPCGSAYKPLSEFARLFAGLEFEFDLQLVIEAEEVPFSVPQGNSDQAPRLGWTSWLKTCEFTKDDDQVVIRSGN